MRRLLIASLALTIACIYSQVPIGYAQQQFVDKNKLPKTETFDLAGLPSYQLEHKVSGTIRSFGFSLGGMMPIWEEGFRKYQPDIRFEDFFPSADVAITYFLSVLDALPTP